MDHTKSSFCTSELQASYCLLVVGHDNKMTDIQCFKHESPLLASGIADIHNNGCFHFLFFLIKQLSNQTLSTTLQGSIIGSAPMISHILPLTTQSMFTHLVTQDRSMDHITDKYRQQRAIEYSRLALNKKRLQCFVFLQTLRAVDSILQ